MTQLDDLQAFVNLELPRRRPLLTVTITGFDGDPNDGGAPAILMGAPVGAWYLRETPVQMYEKLTSGPTTWTEVSADQSRTREAITIPVDYNDGGAVDPPVGALFTSQIAVNAALGAATNFRHLGLAYERLPPHVDHAVVFNLAAGVHRPDAAHSTTTVFDMAAREISVDGSITFNGSTAYTTELGPLTVNTIQAGSFDPYIEVTGTPFTGIEKSLKARYCVTDTGQVLAIHRATTNRLHVTRNITGSPVTVSVVRPSTFLRNSLDDSAQFGGSGGIRARMAGEGFILFNDIQIDNFGGSRGVFAGSGGVFAFTRCNIDHEFQRDQFGNVINDRAFQTSADSLTLIDCLVRSDRVQGNADEPVFVTSIGAHTATISGCVFFDCEDGIFAARRGNKVSFSSSVVDNCGTGTPLTAAIRIDALGFLQADSFSGIHGVLRGGANGTIGVSLSKGSQIDPSVVFNSGLHFEGFTGPCVCVDTESVLGLRNDSGAFGQGFINGPLGGNTDVGVQIDGVDSRADMDVSMCNVTGTAGDIRIEGSIDTYANVLATGPIITADLNKLTRK